MVESSADHAMDVPRGFALPRTKEMPPAKRTWDRSYYEKRVPRLTLEPRPLVSSERPEGPITHLRSRDESSESSESILAMAGAQSTKFRHLKAHRLVSAPPFRRMKKFLRTFPLMGINYLSLMKVLSLVAKSRRRCDELIRSLTARLEEKINLQDHRFFKYTRDRRDLPELYAGTANTRRTLGTLRRVAGTARLGRVADAASTLATIWDRSLVEGSNIDGPCQCQFVNATIVARKAIVTRLLHGVGGDATRVISAIVPRSLAKRLQWDNVTRRVECIIATFRMSVIVHRDTIFCPRAPNLRTPHHYISHQRVRHAYIFSPPPNVVVPAAFSENDQACHQMCYAGEIAKLAFIDHRLSLGTVADGRVTATTWRQRCRQRLPRTRRRRDTVHSRECTSWRAETAAIQAGRESFAAQCHEKTWDVKQNRRETIIAYSGSISNRSACVCAQSVPTVSFVPPISASMLCDESSLRTIVINEPPTAGVRFYAAAKPICVLKRPCGVTSRMNCRQNNHGDWPAETRNSQYGGFPLNADSPVPQTILSYIATNAMGRGNSRSEEEPARHETMIDVTNSRRTNNMHHVQVNLSGSSEAAILGSASDKLDVRPPLLNVHDPIIARAQDSKMASRTPRTALSLAAVASPQLIIIYDDVIARLGALAKPLGDCWSQIAVVVSRFHVAATRFGRLTDEVSLAATSVRRCVDKLVSDKTGVREPHLDSTAFLPLTMLTVHVEMRFFDACTLNRYGSLHRRVFEDSLRVAVLQRVFNRPCCRRTLNYVVYAVGHEVIVAIKAVLSEIIQGIEIEWQHFRTRPRSPSLAAFQRHHDRFLDRAEARSFAHDDWPRNTYVYLHGTALDLVKATADSLPDADISPCCIEFRIAVANLTDALTSNLLQYSARKDALVTVDNQAHTRALVTLVALLVHAE